MVLRALARRVQRVGTLSLLSLVSSGVALILFARNTGSSSPDNIRNKSTKDAGQGVFRIGSDLSVQTWLAILGVTFAVLSYGLATTYTHIFDWSCSLRARRHPSGLDYARYLNSQPHAPTILGLYHGLPVLVLLHYVFLALALALSVGYKFAVIEVTYHTVEELPVAHVRLQPPTAGGVVHGTPSPWITDGPMFEPNRAFVHRDLEYEDGVAALSPPKGFTMGGWANCSDAGFHLLDRGTLVTREVVMVAALVEEGFGGEGPFVMSKEAAAGWVRVETTIPGVWFNGSDELAVIEYRVPAPGTVQIQWAKRGSWLNDETQLGSAERRVTYRMRLAVAEMGRQVLNGSCEHIFEGSGEAMAVSQSSLKLTSAASSVVAGEQRFLAALLDVEGMGPRDGVSVIIRGVMAGWGSQLADTGDARLGHAPPQTEPFGKEDTTGTFFAIMGKSITQYPFYDGERAGKQTGSYYAAANAFLAMGIVAIVVAVARVVIGPPMLTSWMGQHVALALAGSSRDGPGLHDPTASGYQVAGKNLGELSLVFSDGEARFHLEK